MTLIRMYSDNGNTAGFWVQHRTWPNGCAHVQSVGGQKYGRLPVEAELEDVVDAALEHFDVRSGRRIDSPLHLKNDKSFTRIAEPGWYRRR